MKMNTFLKDKKKATNWKFKRNDMPQIQQNP